MKNHVRFVECQGQWGLENWAAASLWSHHWQQEPHRACLLSPRRVGSQELHLVLKWPFRWVQGWEVQQDTGPRLAVRGWLINRMTFKNDRCTERPAMSLRECGGDSQGRMSRESDQEPGHFNRPICQLKEVSGRGENSNAYCRRRERWGPWRSWAPILSEDFDLQNLWVLCSLSCVQLFVTLWTVARQAPLSMGFFRQEYWSGLPFPPPEDFPDPARDQTWVSCIAGKCFYCWTIGEAHEF